MIAPFTHISYGMRIKQALILFVLFCTSYGCSTKTSEETDTIATDSTALNDPAQTDLNSDQSALLQAILGDMENPETIIRGITFGDPIAKVKSTETFKVEEEMPDYVLFSEETPQLETIDVQYSLGPDKKVNKITVDVYLNSEEATKQLWNAGKNYFTEIYSAPKEQKNVLSWNKNAVRVNMENVSRGKDFGLKLEFFPAGKTSLAAN